MCGWKISDCLTNKSEYLCGFLLAVKNKKMTSFVRPQFDAWAAAPMSGFGRNLTVVDKAPPHMLHLIDPYWYVNQPVAVPVNSENVKF